MSINVRHDLAKYAGKRKHGSQLQAHEENGLWKRLKSIEEWEWEILSHALERLEKKGIKASRQDLISTISFASIIEYKIDYNKVIKDYDERVVLRAKAIVNSRYNLHVVYSLTTKSIVTVWINRIDDRHSTLDWSIYSEDMKVFI
jgi:hydrogenase maturation factor HypF (carbamoyltransferase family)